MSYSMSKSMTTQVIFSFIINFNKFRLTVEEHLWFYACLKDANGGNVLKEEMAKY